MDADTKLLALLDTEVLKEFFLREKNSDGDSVRYIRSWLKDAKVLHFSPAVARELGFHDGE